MMMNEVEQRFGRQFIGCKRLFLLTFVEYQDPVAKPEKFRQIA